jgi:ABC-type branched-subunit amino acid transport system substrate-binding protein
LVWIPAAFTVQLDTLTSLRYYADSLEELPSSDNDNDWNNPVFTSFYNKMQPSFFDSIFTYLGLKDSSGFDIGAFKSLLTRVTSNRTKNKSNNNNEDKNDELELVVSPKTQLFIWGDMHGAFHSFVRCLNELQKKGLIDNHLRITNDSVYLVFLGDLVSRSPYSLELLTAVLLIMERNPDKVIYIRGNQETNAYWENFSMRRRLRYFARGYGDEKDGEIPLRTRINAFFSTLPRVFKLKNNEGDGVVYFSHQRPSDNAMKNPHARALLVGEKRNDFVHERKGLEYIGFDRGIAEWTLMSCPTFTYQDFFKFYYDSFVVLDLASKIEQSTLTLFSQDVRALKGFSATVYNLLFGNVLQSETDQEKVFSKPVITFGSTGSITGGEMLFGLPVKWGIDEAVYEINQKGGINGRRVKPFIFDDRYTPRFARKNIEDLHDIYNVDLIVAPSNTPTLMSYIDRIKSGKNWVFFPVTGSESLRNKELKNIIHLRSSYSDEVRVLINYMIDEYNIKRFAFFYETSDYGLPLLEAAHDQLKKRGIGTSLDVPYNPSKTDFAKEAEIIRNGNVEALGLLSSSSPTIELLSSVGVGSLLNLQLFGISGIDVAAVRGYLKQKGIKFTFSVVLNPDQPGLEITKDFEKVVEETGYIKENNLFEGYLATQLFFDAIKNIGEPVTGDRLMNWFENMKNYNFKGLTLTFDSETRSFAMPIWVEKSDGSFIRSKPLDSSFSKQATL